jgi:predicted phage tail protein
MTTIKIHGLLANEYGSEFRAVIDKPKDAWDAVDVNRPGFITRMLDLAREGVYYGVVVNDDHLDYNEMNCSGDFEEVHLVPLILGAGPLLGIIPAFIGKVATAAVGVFGGLGSFFGTFALTAASLFISALLQPTPKLPQPKSPVAGSKDSFIFSNKINVAKQGIPVPLGYGRLRVGSAVVQSTVKSFPQTKDVIDTFATAAGGGAEDYYIVSDSTPSPSYISSTEPRFGEGVWGEIVLRSNYDLGTIPIDPAIDDPQGLTGTAIDKFIAKGVKEDWWSKVKHMYTFTWGNSGASSVDWGWWGDWAYRLF